VKVIDLATRILDPFLPRQHQLTLGVLVGALAILLFSSNFMVDERQATEATASSDSLPDTILLLASVSSLSPLDEPEQHAHKTPEIPTGDQKQPASKFQHITVKPGDNLSLIFGRAGFGPSDVYALTSSVTDKKILTRLYPGYELVFESDNNNQLLSVEIIESALLSHHYELDEEQHYVYSEVTRTPEVRQVMRDAVITDSLFLAAQRSKIPAGITMEAAGIFGGVIDFILDVREGDTFSILYEEKYLDGELIENGRILAAQFTNQGTTNTALRYTNSLGESNFYNPEGESMRKAFLLNPVDFTRISSGFSLSRKHPILNTIRAHKGTDYAAPRGTPVVATADGRISFAGKNGSFGNLVVIKHDDQFETKYAHLNGYARGIQSGARVKQGQVIGYVGSTGSATGPHLHYEFLMDGVHRNSRTIYQFLPKAVSVPASELALFHEQTSALLARISEASYRQIAFVGPPAELE
jgi:murein DD-endopeptidase MepM/ murein hydrolase activator NlpD